MVAERLVPAKGVILSTAWSACLKASPDTPKRTPWHQHCHGAAGSSGAMEDADTEVVYKIRQ